MGERPFLVISQDKHSTHCRLDMSEPCLIRDDLALLTIKQILSHVRSFMALPRGAARHKSQLLDHVHARVNAEPSNPLYTPLLEAVRAKRLVCKGKPKRKRKTDATAPYEHKKARIEDTECSTFMCLPTDEERRQCHTRFIDATGNKALAQGVCAVCARECGAMDEKLASCRLSDIPNRHRLLPVQPHPAHDLYEGMLLDPAGLSHNTAGWTVNICTSCSTQLRDPRSSSPPTLSLANGLWIGKVPWQLQILSFPEQLLIALLYPRVYVFKLFPKKTAGLRDADNLQRSMRGNVSTFELSPDGVADMLEGRLMPRPPRILASLISVTFISGGQLHKKWLHSMFRVRRRVVHNALTWLKENNSAYYGDVEISIERIQQLPEDDVPEELLHGVRQCTDSGVVDQESEGYVPRDEEEDFDHDHDLHGNFALLSFFLKRQTRSAELVC
jgi:hypothetical protein